MQFKHTHNCAKQGRKFVVDFAQILGEMRPVELDTNQLAAVKFKQHRSSALQHCNDEKVRAVATNNKPLALVILANNAQTFRASGT